MENWQTEYKNRLKEQGLEAIKTEYYELALSNHSQDKRTTNGRYNTIFNNAKLLCLTDLLKEKGLTAKVVETKIKFEVIFEENKNELEKLLDSLDYTEEDIKAWRKIEDYNNAEMLQRELESMLDYGGITQEELEKCTANCSKILESYQNSINFDYEEGEFMREAIADYLENEEANNE